jgi:hypothetical protein
MFMMHLWIKPHFPASSTSLILATKLNTRKLLHAVILESTAGQNGQCSDWAMGWKFWSSIPAKARDFLLQNALTNPALYPMDTQGSFLEVKQPRREVDHSLPSSAKVRNQQIYTLCTHPPPSPDNFTWQKHYLNKKFHIFPGFITIPDIKRHFYLTSACTYQFVITGYSTIKLQCLGVF